MRGEDEALSERLRRLWTVREPRQRLAALAREGGAQGGDWDPPAGVQPRAEVLPLDIGIPDATSLPRAALSEAFAAVLERPDDAALRYGMRRGYLPLRSYLAEKYTRERGFPVDASWFQLCNGSAGAIDLVVRALIDPGDVIVSEAPTYLGTLRNFRGVGAEVVAAPIDEHGLRVDALASLCDALARAGKRLKLVYTISAFQNPTGRTLSAERRVQLLELAAEHDFCVLDDDAYGDLYYDARPDLPAMSALAEGHGVITVGSLSKVLATGLRIGWVHARPELIEQLQRVRFEMGQNQLGLHAVGRFVAEGRLEPHLHAMRALYRDKMNVLADALERFAGPYLRFGRPAGGFYLWVKLAPGLSATSVVRTAYQEGVSVSPGHAFFPSRREDDGDHLRLAFSWPPQDVLPLAAERLARACARVAEGDSA